MVAGDKNLHEGMAQDDLPEFHNMTQLIDRPTNIEPGGYVMCRLDCYLLAKFIY